MKWYLAVLIAAVTVNCLVTTINAKATDTLNIPYTDMLLPPLEDVQDNSNDATKQSLNIKTAASSTSSATTTTTKKKPIINDVDNILPEAKIEQEEENVNKQHITKESITYTTSKNTQKPTTITTARTTTRKPRTTIKPLTTTTTLKPSQIEVPSLFLDSLLPPLVDNTVDNIENKQNILEIPTTTHKPLLDTAIFKTTKKSYYQQQAQHLKELHLIDQDETHLKNHAGQQQFQHKTKSQSQQVVLPNQQHLHKNIEKLTMQYVAEQKKFSNNDPRKYNYSFDLYLGTTTPRPIKSGLPTITAFPHSLGR